MKAIHGRFFPGTSCSTGKSMKATHGRFFPGTSCSTGKSVKTTRARFLSGASSLAGKSISSTNTGFLVAGALHGVLLSIWLAYQATGAIYRETLRLDFQFSEGGGAITSQNNAVANEQNADNAAQPAENQQSTEAAPTGKPVSSPSSSGAPGVAYAGQNLSAISGLIHGRVHYPRIARRNNWEGKVLVSFTVGTDGKTYDASIRESSGHAVLDESALETIRALEGLPRPPIPVPVSVPVYFRIKRGET